MDTRLKILDYGYNDAEIFQEAERISKEKNYSDLVNIQALTQNWNQMAAKIQDTQLEDQLEDLKQKHFRSYSRPLNAKEK